ncbi:MAG: copper oxidase [Deltaproteobacteria bacterium]|nr:copper oxidase [Deltaproteobacteria bacterium]
MALLAAPGPALADVTAHVVAIDQTLVYNRLGAVNPNGMIFALERDVVRNATTGLWELRPDKRPRPLVLRVNEGETLRIVFTNRLAPRVGEQPATTEVGIHVAGLELVGDITSDGSNVGQNASSLAGPGGSATYTLRAHKEGAYLLNSTGANTGGEGGIGTIAWGLFGAVNVEPAGSVWYRSQVTRDDLELARTGSNPDGSPILDYDAVYPAGHRFEGLPILRIVDPNSREIVHSDLNAVVADIPPGHYPVNPAYPNREDPFREFTAVFHDEIQVNQAFPAIYQDPAFVFALGSVKDGFAINYGTGGIGTEILANRLGVGPTKDCVDCKAEEFFLTSWAVGDPAMVTDVLANASDPANGVVAQRALYPDDPSNVFHSYLNDHVKLRNLHIGKEHHVFHLHSHQWLFTPDDDNSNYLDAQGIGPGSSYTYEMVHGGSGNRNKTPGDAIFHCHFYPHFAQGMWALWRVHDVFEEGTQLDPVTGIPVAGARALPDGEVAAGTPIPAVVPMPRLAMAPMPQADVAIVNGQAQITAKAGLELGNPGYPFFIPGVAGHRPPTPPLDIDVDGGLPRHVITGGTAWEEHTPLSFDKKVLTATAVYPPETGTPVELAAMAFHAFRDGANLPRIPTFTSAGAQADFEINGLPQQPGAPYADPCRTDGTANPIPLNRTYRAANIQLDMQLNKVGWHFTQSRIEALNGDVAATLAGTRPPEPFVMRANTGDCVEFFHTNLIPSVYEQDDFQIKTPTDVIGQHIHLVKFDVTSADGSANGFNYEDATLSPDEVRERIDAINAANSQPTPGTALVATAHPAFGAGPNGRWLGARTTIQRWYVDPLVNNKGEDRGLGNVFTHDHLGPSTHQQAGLYATFLVEPQGSTWHDPETGAMLGSRNTPNGDGGPTSWKADIRNGAKSTREFFLEFADFQLAYTADGKPVNPPDHIEVGLPFLVQGNNVIGPCGRTLCPEAVSSRDVGTFVVNYRNEPLALRVRDPATNLQASGLAGDLSYAFSSWISRKEAKLNSFGPYGPLTKGVSPTDPFTPLLRVYDGDSVNVRVQVGATEETHNVSIHGVKWLQEYASPNSGYRNSQAMGISEQFQLRSPVAETSRAVGVVADYRYAMDTSVDGLWNGDWGLMRSYRVRIPDLQPLPNNPVDAKIGLTITNASNFQQMCPVGAPARNYDVTAIRAADALASAAGKRDGKLVYNARALNGGPLTDPTSLLYVMTSDLGTDGRLKPGVPVEPLILRAAAGECINVKLRNRLPSNLAVPDPAFPTQTKDLAGFNTLPMIVENFNANQIGPSSWAGLHPQLVAYDVTKSDGANVGFNLPQTVLAGNTLLPTTYRWYAGEVWLDGTTLKSRPAELGAVNLTSSDPIKHSSKGAVGALIIEPAGAKWVEDGSPQDTLKRPRSRAQATVTLPDGSSFRDLVLVLQSDLNLRWKGNAPVPPSLLADDSEDSGMMAVNYKTEPLWLRLGYSPDALPVDVGNLNFRDSLSIATGEPQTPTLTAAPGQAVRLRVLNPGGQGRNSVFTLHGHAWQREPYVNDSGALGHNPFSFVRGGQEGVGPSSHWDFVLENGAGGAGGVRGDYLYRDFTPLHFENGAWGVLRVQ